MNAFTRLRVEYLGALGEKESDCAIQWNKQNILLNTLQNTFVSLVTGCPAVSLVFLFRLLLVATTADITGLFVAHAGT